MMDHYRMAHFKFGLIAPVIQDTYPDKSPGAYYRRIAEKPLLRPDGTEFQYKAKSIQAWELLYRNGGMDALIRPSRKDKGTTRALTDDAVSEIYRLRDKYPRLNAAQIHSRLLDEGVITSRVSVRCVQRFVKDWNLKVGTPSVDMKDRKAFEEEYFGGMWQADSCHFPFIPDVNGVPRKTYLIMIIDDHSRMIVAARIFFNDNAVNFQTALKSAVATYGIPNKVFVDNGGPYVNHQTEFICDSIGTVLLHAKVRDGAAKGKIERAFRTIQESWLYGLDISTVKSLEEINSLLSEFIRTYNLKVHSSTGETPIDRFLKSRERIKTPKSEEWLDECFLHREKRFVRHDATLSINKVQYDVSMQFIGQTIEVHFWPGHMEKAYILYDKKRYPLRKTNKVENGRTKRANLRIDYNLTGGDAHA
jgi:transposase InsO family protein